MRLFVALEIPAGVRDNLAAFIDDMRDLSRQLDEKRARWVRPENLHVTLKFIGAVAPESFEGIRTTLSRVRSTGPVELQLRGLGYFPNEKHPRVLWVGLNAPSNLAALASDIDYALETQGIPREKRAFSPHLTMARLEPPGLHENVSAAIAKQSTREFGWFQACEFHLIESKLNPHGAEYTHAASFRFTLEA